MMWLEYGFYVYCMLYMVYACTLFYLIHIRDKRNNSKAQTTFPFVSILVAAKDEEHNIARCLQALAALDYPKDRYEVLIGNDASEDHTAAIVEQFIKAHAHFQLIHIYGKLGDAQAKANVLAHLAHKAQGEIYFVTDADIAVKPQWLQEMLSFYDAGKAIVSGSTLVQGKSLFARLQGIEWMYAFSMVASVKHLGIPVTAVGNNMLISRAAYEATGGYEKIPFSVTEDFELFIQTLKQGWKFDNIMTPGSIAYSRPTESYLSLLKQRKRWMQGAVRLPVKLMFFLTIQSMFFPVIITSLFLYPIPALVFWGLKFMLQMAFIAKAYRRVGEPFPSIVSVICYELYSMVISFSIVVYFLIPGKIEWKGRKF
jgi:cellulose synthase/poly-beta-1,6-N-acetylglucosamine synthase-like glycosyltransferase